MSTRSHHGCARCKRRRQKCDEARPTCGRCQQANTECSYVTVLKWSGRVPRIDGHSRKVRRAPKQSITTLNVVTWPSTEQALMHHFINHTSNIIGHRYMRDQTCRDLVPLANERPALRYAIMAMSATHRAALLDKQSDISISELITQSLFHLRQDLNGPQDDSVLQTIKTLCICEIYSGKADSSWRTHVGGAAAILGARTGGGLINQWYQSMEALTALTTRGPLAETEIRPIVVEEYAIVDMYTGYTPDLNSAFRQIGLLSRGGTEEQVIQLEGAVIRMIQRDERSLKFPADIELDRDEIRQFAACNTAYQHCALIHIYRRLQKLGADTPQIQASVRKILNTLSSILPMNALSPWALLTTPLFTAGCEAIGEDRDIVRNLLQDLYTTLRIRNILRAAEILEAQWSSDGKPEELHALDFIPY